MQNLGKKIFYVYGASSQPWGRGLEPRPSDTHHTTPWLNGLGPAVNTWSFFNAAFLVEKSPSALLFSLLKTLVISSLNIFMANVPHLFFCQSCALA